MYPETYRMVAERQYDYWWYRARREMARLLLRRYGVPPRGKWLDLGCGPGGNLGISDPFRADLVVGVDLSPMALDFARGNAPNALLVQADIGRGLPFADGTFDVATIFNVLYHAWIASELEVLRDAARVLRPGGLVLITEPAFPMLAREMDVIAMARRRYHLPEFTAMCRDAGFQVLFGSYFASFGFPLLLGMKHLRRAMAGRRPAAEPAPDMKPLRPFVNESMYALALLEARAIAGGIPMPIGTTLICVARKV